VIKVNASGGKLILFDIDGTILYTAGAGRRAMRQSLLEVYGATGPIEKFPFAGKTDPQIVKELMTLARFAPRLIEQKMDHFWDVYLERLREEMIRVDHLVVYPGVVELIQELHERDGVILGLLTGNIQQGARLKLEPTGLNQYFPVGAFGDDSADRNQLPRIAVRRVRERYGRSFRGQDVVIVGDTPADIACARHFGARAIVVATGFQRREELERAKPDALFDDFCDREQVRAALLG